MYRILEYSRIITTVAMTAVIVIHVPMRAGALDGPLKSETSPGGGKAAGILLSEGGVCDMMP